MAYLSLALVALGVLAMSSTPRVLRPRFARDADGAMRYVRLAARITSGLVKALVYAALCLAVLAMLAVAMAPQVSGVRFATILSDSMRPSMTTGDMIVVRPVDPRQIEAGDVILFHTPTDPSTTIAHRVVEIVDSGSGPAFVTKGDANKVEDHGAVPSSRVLGKVQFRVPLLGYVTREMREPLVFVLVLAVPGSLLIASEVWNIVRALKRGRSKELGAGLRRDP